MLTYDNELNAKLDKILEELQAQKDWLDEFKEEMLERFANLNSEGPDYMLDELEDE